VEGTIPELQEALANASDQQISQILFTESLPPALNTPENQRLRRLFQDAQSGLRHEQFGAAFTPNEEAVFRSIVGDLRTQDPSVVREWANSAAQRFQRARNYLEAAYQDVLSVQAGEATRAVATPARSRPNQPAGQPAQSAEQQVDQLLRQIMQNRGR
jgi:hypothetical protein